MNVNRPYKSFRFRLNRKDFRFLYFVALSDGKTGVHFCRKHFRMTLDR